MINVKKLLTRILQELYDNRETKTVTLPGRVVTIPAGSASSPSILEVNFANDYDSSKYYLWAVECVMGNYALPYINPSNTAHTHIQSVYSTKCVIQSTTSVWSDYMAYFTLFLKRK